MRIGKIALALAATATLASVASAEYVISPASGVTWDLGSPVLGPENVTPGSSFVQFTGLATAANALALLESSTTPARDDVVSFDGVSEQINDYIAAAGSTQRFVTESDVLNGDGTRTLTVTVSAVNPAGGFGDLWPSGFSSGGNALTGGAWGIGTGLPDSLDGIATPGTDGLNIDAGDTLLSSSLAISVGGSFGAPIAIPATLFFGTGATFPRAGWNGNLSLALGGGANNADIQDALQFVVNYQPVPEPTSMGVLALAATALGRRRRA